MFTLKLKTESPYSPFHIVHILLITLFTLLFVRELKADSLGFPPGYEMFIRNVTNGIEEIRLNQLAVDKAQNSIEKTFSIYDPRFYSSVQAYGVRNFDDFQNNRIYTSGTRINTGIEKN